MGHIQRELSDVRNTKVSDLSSEFTWLGAQVDIYDPLINLTDVSENMRERIVLKPKSRHYDAVLLTVPHDKFLDMGEEVIKEFESQAHCFLT